MGLQNIIDVICCRTCKELKVDEERLQRKDAFRRKLPRNKVEPQETKRIPTDQEIGGGDKKANELNMEDNTAPRTHSARSGASSAASHVSDVSRAASAQAKRAIEVAYNQLIEEMKVADPRNSSDQ